MVIILISDCINTSGAENHDTCVITCLYYYGVRFVQLLTYYTFLNFGFIADWFKEKKTETERIYRG